VWACAQLLGALLFLGAVPALVAGCSPEPGAGPRVGRGRYEARSEGAIETALEGEAVYRTDEDGRLVGLELGAIDAASGLSIEFEARPLAPRTYEVVTPDLLGSAPADAPPGATAYFAHDDLALTATSGIVQVTGVEGGVVTASFDLLLDGALPEVHAELSAHVTGQLRAVPMGERRLPWLVLSRVFEPRGERSGNEERRRYNQRGLRRRHHHAAHRRLGQLEQAREVVARPSYEPERGR
jgi:hypothetical protein